VHSETVEECMRATHLIALPRQVDLRQALPEAVIDRRLPQAPEPPLPTGPAPRAG
jgi:hypothetical protein